MKATQTMFKAGYDGAKPSPRLTTDEKAKLAAAADPLIRRLHDAMLVLSIMDDDDLAGKGSGWPSYIHDRGDKNSQAENYEPTPVRKHFDPKPAQMSDFLPAMALLEGLRPIYQKVLFLRAIGEFHGGWSFDEIGEHFERTGEWARGLYQSVVTQAARRAGLLPQAEQGWALLVAGLRHGGWRSYLTSAREPAKQLRNLKSLSPLAIEEAFCIWVAGQPVATRVLKDVRRQLLGRPVHGSWHLIRPDDMADKIVGAARAVGATWSMEELPVSRVGTRIIRPDEGWDLGGEDEA